MARANRRLESAVLAPVRDHVKDDYCSNPLKPLHSSRFLDVAHVAAQRRLPPRRTPRGLRGLVRGKRMGSLREQRGFVQPLSDRVGYKRGDRSVAAFLRQSCPSDCVLFKQMLSLIVDDVTRRTSSAYVYLNFAAMF